MIAGFGRVGMPVFYGNAARPELLNRLHIRDAVALFITIDQPAAAMHTLLSARAAHPKLPIDVRSMDESRAHELRAASATAVIPGILEASLQRLRWPRPAWMTMRWRRRSVGSVIREFKQIFSKPNF